MTRTQRLRGQLESFAPVDNSEARHRGRMLDLLDSAPDPFSRSHFDPGHFTGSAFVLSPDRGSLLLVFHGKLRRWLQPGGHVEAKDADLEVAARRETFEETGIRATSVAQANGPLFDLDIHTIPARPKNNEPAHEHFDVRFLFIATDARPRAASDAHDARWVSLDQISDDLTDASVMRAVQKIRSV